MASATLESGSVLGHFRLEAPLGKGGMATVYLARDLTLNRPVALKFLDRGRLTLHEDVGRTHQLERRFIREARNAGTISHPNIAQIYEASFEDEDWFIAMEFVDNGSIHDRLRAGHVFTLAQLVQVAEQVAHGLAYGWYDYQIIHRDIKPQNIMLTRRGAAKIVDLGLAKPLTAVERELEDLTESGLAVGSPLYMAPEQCEGVEDIDFRVDIYALGATLYEMCTGRRAFAGRTAFQVYRAHREKDYRPIDEFRKDLPPLLLQTIDDMLEPDPANRLDSYDELLRRLRDLRLQYQLPGELQPLPPPSGGESDLGDGERTMVETPLPAPAEQRDSGGRVLTPPTGYCRVSGDQDLGQSDPLAMTVAATPAPDQTRSLPAAAAPEPPPRPARQRREPPPSSPFERVQKPLVVGAAAPPRLPGTPDDPEEEQEDVVERRTKALVQMIRTRGRLPALENNVIDICSVARSSTTRAADLSAVIMRDSALTAALLRVINSALYGLRVKVRTVSAAVILLGFEKVQSLALQLSIFRTSRHSAKGRRLFKLLTSSYFCGTFARSLARRLLFGNPEEAFVAGLLHRLPRQALAATFPSDYEQMETLMVEQRLDEATACRQVFDVDYGELCQGIIDAWNLPENVAETLNYRDKMSGKLGTVVVEASRLSDMLVAGGSDQAEVAALEHRLQSLVHDDEFTVSHFVHEVCRDDENIGRVFNLEDEDVSAMIESLEQGGSNLVASEVMLAEERSPEQLARDLLDELTEAVAGGSNLNDVLLIAQEAVYRMLTPAHVFTVFFDRRKTMLRGRFYIGELDGLRPTDFAVRAYDERRPAVRALVARRPVELSPEELAASLPRGMAQRLAAKYTLIMPIAAFQTPLGFYCIIRTAQPPFSRLEIQRAALVAAEVGKGFAATRRIPAGA